MQQKEKELADNIIEEVLEYAVGVPDFPIPEGADVDIEVKIEDYVYKNGRYSGRKVIDVLRENIIKLIRDEKL